MGCHGYSNREQTRVLITPLCDHLHQVTNVYCYRDLYSLVHFLRIQPWCQYSYWHAFITGPFEEKKDSKAFEVVKSVMEPIILRRTKDMRDAKTGKLIVELPERVVDIVALDFSTEEKEIYDALNVYSKKELKNLKLIGQMDYTHVFQLVLSMRLVCDHPLLIRKNASGAMAKTLELKDLIGRYCGMSRGLTSSDKENQAGSRQNKLTDYAKSVMGDLNDGETQECPASLFILLYMLRIDMTSGMPG